MTRLLLFLFLPLSGLAQVVTGADQVNELVTKWKGQRVGLVVNQTSLVRRTHLIDTLVSRGVNVVKIYAPEHGYRGEAADGDFISDGKDLKTGIPVASIYGKSMKPSPEQLADVDVVAFDIQDVGTRFFTFISTMHKVMEACAENGKKVVILDRPNPNGDYIDGPVLHDESLRSFVGMHPIPIVHGMTVGELARMINGEGWLTNKLKCDLEVVPIKGWKHKDTWHIVVRPSPNLPNDQAIRLYPSLCLFEGTVISIGRGTQTPFQIIGNPLLKDLPYQFTPVSIQGMSTQPPHKDVLCYGLDLRTAKVKPCIDLSYLLDIYKRYPEKEKFFTSYFDKLAGTKLLKDQIVQGMTEDQIKATWKKDLDAFQARRAPYLLYP